MSVRERFALWFTYAEYHLSRDFAYEGGYETRGNEAINCERYQPSHALKRCRATEVVDELDVVYPNISC
jgi:hypothetical protein